MIAPVTVNRAVPIVPVFLTDRVVKHTPHLKHLPS